MSVYIKGMEMPTSCYYCPFADGSWGYSPPHKKRCLISGKDMPVDERYVQHNQSVCPLVPVPPHGRLVDADALIDKVIAKYLKFEREGKLVFAAAEIKQDIVDLISDAPTIIPASGGTNNE